MSSKHNSESLSNAKKAELHTGHRGRMYEKFEKNNYEPYGFPDHEILEMFLFLFFKRMNTNEIAHSLLERFGSLKGVLSAGKSELCEVKGISERAAEFIILNGEFYRQIMTLEKRKEDPNGFVNDRFFTGKPVGDKNSYMKVNTGSAKKTDEPEKKPVNNFVEKNENKPSESLDENSDKKLDEKPVNVSDKTSAEKKVKSSDNDTNAKNLSESAEPEDMTLFPYPDDDYIF